MSSQLKSPFPGMDPFLEVNPRWQAFHGWFIRELARLHSARAQESGCWIDVERDVYRREPDGQLVLVGEPDALVDSDLTVSRWSSSSKFDAGVALAEPAAMHEVVLDPAQMDVYKQDYLVVRELGNFNRVLAVLELLSFANKEGGYAPRYLEKRMRLLTSRSHFMEIDFLRKGENPSRQKFSELPSTPYFIFVARKNDIGRTEEGYPIRLQDRLPVIGLPLRSGRPDLPLDLPAAFASAFALSIRPGIIQYHEESIPAPELTLEDAAWVKRTIEDKSSA